MRLSRDCGIARRVLKRRSIDYRLLRINLLSKKMMRRILQRKLFHSSSYPFHSGRKICLAVSIQNHKCTEESSQRFPFPARATPSFAHKGFRCSFAIQKHFLSRKAQVNTVGPITGIVEVPLAQTGRLG